MAEILNFVQELMGFGDKARRFDCEFGSPAYQRDRLRMRSLMVIMGKEGGGDPGRQVAGDCCWSRRVMRCVVGSLPLTKGYDVAS